MKKNLILLALPIFAACSTYSKKQCEEMDWNLQAFNLSLNGNSLQDTQQYFERECGEKHEVKPDNQKLKLGHDNGIAYLCTPEGGLRLGSNGKTYRNTCPKEKEPTFIGAYKEGRIDYLEKLVERLQSENSSLSSEVSALESQVFSLQGQISSAPSCP